MLKTTAGGQTALAAFEKKLTGRVPDDSAVPYSVRRGSRLMLAGAAITFATGLFSIIVLLVYRNSLITSTGTRVSNGALAGDIVQVIIFYAILAAMWVLMARFNRAGAKWARLVASLFAVLWTIYTYYWVNSLRGGESVTWDGIVGLAITLVVWLVGLFSMAMVWRPESSVYYNARSSSR